jgi:gamma-glutamylcyclotransferase (GGCT)/AIG2-like uncharacterized protein YtfP
MREPFMLHSTPMAGDSYTMSSGRLFTYGTLMFPEVMETVAGGRFEGRGATLMGYARYGLWGETYPGLIAQAGSETEGMVYDGLEAVHLGRLDRFEGDWYDRRTVSIQVSGGETIDSDVYVLRDAHRHRLSRDPWDAQRFSECFLGPFLAAYGGFRRL